MTIINPRMSISVLVPDFRDGELWVLCTTRKKENEDDPDQWCFPGGKANPREAPNVAASRELFEETGVTTIPNMLTSVYTALDEHGWICTTFLATTSEIVDPETKGRRLLKRDEDRFKPEEGTKVEWKPASFLLDPENTPFVGYYREMFVSLNFFTLREAFPDVAEWERKMEELKGHLTDDEDPATS